MSGGVDSSVAALRLMEDGHQVAGVTLRLTDSEADDLNVYYAAEVCARLGITHTALDLRYAFRDAVEEPFCVEYLSGRTPNPCVLCNRSIKFGALLDWAMDNGFERLATGHYARLGLVGQTGRAVLLRAADRDKDQTYMLWTLRNAQLERIVFPLGELTKSEVRAIAAKAGLKSADRKDSQDICFVPDGDHVSFIARQMGLLPQPGDILDASGKVIGRHEGHIHYTLGQRRGTGVSSSGRAYVVEKDAQKNTVTLGASELLMKREVTVRDVNLTGTDSIDNVRAEVKLRYTRQGADAQIFADGTGRIKILFDNPVRAPVPGQSAVFYAGDLVLGGGVIDAAR